MYMYHVFHICAHLNICQHGHCFLQMELVLVNFPEKYGLQCIITLLYSNAK